MAKDKRSKLSDSIESIKEELLRDNGESEEERKFQEIIREALEAGRVPIECIEYVQVTEDMAVKTVVMKEC